MSDTVIRQLVASPTGSLLGRILATAPIGAAFGVDGKIAYANRVCALMFGFDDPSEMLDVSFFGMIHPDSHEYLYRVWNARSGDAVDPWTYELDGIRRDGSVFRFRASSLSIDVATGARGAFVFLEDLGDERLGDSELERRRAALEGLLGE